jgi:hypothetical protein
MFLLVEYFPVHDELCHEEGRLMKEYANSSDAETSKNAKSRLAALKGQTQKLLDKYWG